MTTLRNCGLHSLYIQRGLIVYRPINDTDQLTKKLRKLRSLQMRLRRAIIRYIIISIIKYQYM